MKKESKVANSSEDRKDSLLKSLTLVLLLKILSTQMLMCLLRKEWVEEKGINLSLAYAP